MQHVKVVNTHGDARNFGYLNSSQGTGTFQLWNGDRGYIARVACQHMNDFALLSHMDTIVLGGTNGSRLWYNYHTRKISRSKSHPNSDMLCVETDRLSWSRPDLVFHGHRNGAITMNDSRTSKRNTPTLAFPAGTGMEVDNFGSVARIQLLFDQRPDQLLARGSNTTCCRLFDVRSLGEPSTQHRGRSAMIREMATAPNTTSSAKGMAADPHRAIAIVPFKNETQRACFGMWSLDSGEFIGHKTLQRR
jgi:hypothetical protein